MRFVIVLGFNLLVVTSLKAGTLKETIDKKYQESLKPWARVHQLFGVKAGDSRIGLGMNDDGSIQFEFPAIPPKSDGFFSHPALIDIESDLDAVCDWLGRSRDPYQSTLSTGYANPVSLRGGGWTSSCLGIPHIPDSYSTSHYGYFSGSDRFRSYERVGINGENIGKISCYFNHNQPPVSKNFKKMIIDESKETATIVKPSFMWVEGLFAGKRPISALTDQDVVCQHFGLEKAIESETETDKSCFGKSVELNSDRRVIAEYACSSKEGVYYKKITCR